MDLSVSFIFGEAWELAKKHGLAIALFLFVSYLISGGISLYFLPPGYINAIQSGNAQQLQTMQNHMGTFYLGTILSYAVSIVLSLGLYNGLLAVCRGGSFNLAGFSRPLNTYLKFFCTSVIYYMIVSLGLMCCVIPGIYLAIRFGFACFYCLDNDQSSVVDAFKWSWAATSGKELELIGLAIVAIIVAAVGFAVCCVGVFFTSAISCLAIVITYLVLLDRMNIEKVKQ